MITPSTPAAIPRLPEPVLAALAAAIVVATIVLACGGGDMLGGRPISLSPDAVYHYAIAKTVLVDGWSWHASRLGAPFGCDLVAFGLNLPLESAVMRLVSLTTGDPVALLNRTWVIFCGLAAVNAYAGFRLLDLPRAVALVCACLFATTPYVFFRSVEHFNLHCAFLPVPVAAAVLTVTGGLRDLGPRTWLGVCGGCLLLGLGFIYYSCFLAVLFIHALAIAWLTGRTAGIARGTACLAAVVAGAAVNLAPVAVSWATAGKPAELAYRTPQDADLFALRIRDLILPSEFTPVPGLRAIGRKVAKTAWPLPTESRIAKIGTVAAVGFVICLWVLVGLAPPGERRHAAAVRAAAVLTLVLVMVGTLGGFGSIFNLFVSPVIRCYNRVAPALAFLALIPVGSLLDAACRGRAAARATALLAAVLGFGLVEQNTAEPLRAAAAAHRAERDRVEAFVRDVERDTTPADTVLMLPATAFPVDHGCGDLPAYDHAKAYLFSGRLRWSWPVFGSRQRALLESLGPGTAPGFVAHARAAGFTHAWLDGRGTGAADLQAALEAGGAELAQADDRYRFYRLAASGADDGR